MSDPSRLDARLRAALGAQSPAGIAGAGGGDAAKTRVLAGIRRRRLRRLQVTGAAVVVALGLAVGLPQALGSGALPAPAAGTSAAASVPASGGPVHGAGGVVRLGPAVHSARAATATCRVNDGAARTCGVLTTNPAAQPLAGTAASPTRGSVPSTNSLGPPLVVQAGGRLVIDLPDTSDHWRWTIPAIAGEPVHHGRVPPVVVRATRSHGARQQFLVTSTAPVTVVLEAQDDVYTGKGAAPSRVAGSSTVWTLELEVEAK